MSGQTRKLFLLAPIERLVIFPETKATKKISHVFATKYLPFLPKMKGAQLLDVVDDRGQPKEAKYEFSLVIERGNNLYACRDHMLIHTDFIRLCAYFDICQFYKATKFL